MPKPFPTLPYRLAVASRTLAAVVGGYAVAALLAMAVARGLPLSRSEAATIATIAAVLALPFIAIRVFAVSSASRAWAELVLASLLLGGLAWAFGRPG